MRGEADHYRQRPELEKIWNDYIPLGGLPERLTVTDPQAVRSYQEGIVAKVILDDVVRRFKVEQVTALERLSSFLLASPGQIVSYATLARRLSALGTKVKVDTVIRYVSFVKAAFAVFDLSRFDWKQGRYFDTTRKYYSIDTGIASLYRSETENRVREISAFLHAEPFLSGGESLLLVEEGEREEITTDGVRIKVEPILRWALSV